MELLFPAEAGFSDDLEDALSYQNGGGWEVVHFKRVWNFQQKIEEGRKAIEIEPSELHQFIHFVIVDFEMQMVLLHSSFQNISKGTREIGWKTTTDHNITQTMKEDTNASEK